MQSLGKIEKIDDLRSVWPNEAADFTKWLAQEDNLALLSDTIGVDILLEEKESPVGDFSVDIYAKENGTGRKVIIENQLEDTNHDHLGKIITYASGKGAEVIIWIVKRAREEHKQAIEWLNQHTDENIGFFLIEIELWRIKDSPLAPRFNVVEEPNDWAKVFKNAEKLSDTQKLQLDFWQSFNDFAFASDKDFRKVFSERKAQAQHWYDLSVGSSAYHVALTVNTIKKRMSVGIYIDDDKDLFEKFKESKTEIESLLGMPLEWISAKKACRFLTTKEASIRDDRAKWPQYFEWFCEMSLKMREIVKKYDKSV